MFWLGLMFFFIQPCPRLGSRTIYLFRLLIVSFLCLSPPRAHNCLVSMLLSPVPLPVIDQMESLSLFPIYYNNRGYRSEYWANSDLPEGAGQQNTHDYVPQYRAAHLFPTALMNIHLCLSLALVALNLPPNFAITSIQGGASPFCTIDPWV